MISDAFDPRLLRVFVAVCSHGSINRAASELGRTQFALSMQIRRLEDVVGQPLLRRTGRGVVPTDDGEVMLAYARRILMLCEEAAAHFRKNVEIGEIRIGLTETIADSTLPSALARLRRTFPGLHLNVTIDHGSALGQRWNDGMLDLAVATCSAFSADPLEVWDVNLNWVCGIDATLDLASPLDVIVNAEPCAWRRIMFDKLMEAELEFRVVLTSHNMGAMITAVENGLGLALMTSESVNTRTMRVVSSSFGGTPPTVKYGLYAARNRSNTIDAAIDVVRENLGALTG
ncbi:LysR family transcriptional regulator [Thalassospira sp. NFXS8]|uniref:LysR family transcriptional regulator n=1 Tax=Thalassospira sp. NFXS8 TaxID=2819093 RepID=UPI0032DEBEB6